MRKFFEPIQLELKVLFAGTGMIGLIAQQLAPGRQFVPTHAGDELDLARLFTKGAGLVEGKIIHGNDLGRSPQRNAIPAEQAGNLQITRGRHEAYQDQVSIGKHIPILYPRRGLDGLRFIGENYHMIRQNALTFEIRILEPLRVVFRECIFRDPARNYDREIRQTFQFLREWSICMGLHPAELIHVGIPGLAGDRLAAYTCCLEYVLPFIDENAEVSLGELPGGRYAVVRVEKVPSKIGQAIREFHSVYMHEELLVQDLHRPVYEVYYEKDMEYCVPLAE